MTSILKPLGSETFTRASGLNEVTAFNLLNFCLRSFFDQFTSVPTLMPVSFMISNFVTPFLRSDFTSALIVSL